MSVTWSMFFGAAEANTSAGAPWLICWASAELPAKLNITFTPGCAASKSLPSWVNVPVSDAAANTVTVPDTEAPCWTTADGEAAGVSSPQPARVSAATAASAASAVRRNIRPPGSRRRHGWT